MLHQTSLKDYTHYNKTTIRARKIESFSPVFCKTQTASIVTILKFQWLRHCTGKQILEGFFASFKTKKIIIINTQEDHVQMLNVPVHEN